MVRERERAYIDRPQAAVGDELPHRALGAVVVGGEHDDVAGKRRRSGLARDDQQPRSHAWTVPTWLAQPHAATQLFDTESEPTMPAELL